MTTAPARPGPPASPGRLDVTTAAARPGLPVLRVALLLVAFAAAVGLRVAVGGAGVAGSAAAGLVFAGCLLGLVLAAGTRVPVRPRALLAGLAGAAVICLPVGVEHLLAPRPLPPATGFASWALAVTVVATAEEVFLRGTLYDAVRDLAGTCWAVGVAALVFALLHVPLYGWRVLPLDLAVGVVLGGLRAHTGSLAAPAVAHVGADLAGWFLR